MRSTLARQTSAGLRLLLAMTVLTGILYPLAVWGVTRLPGLVGNAEGSIITHHGSPVGSELIGIDLVDPRARADPALDRYFHTRPSASAKTPLGPGDPATTGGSNLAADSRALLAAVQERKQAIALREAVAPQQVPADAVTASASGVDPQISPDYAHLQVPRVARNNGLPEQQVRAIVDARTRGRDGGFLGDLAVNVLQLNLAVAEAAHS
ncbi:potassium-transporting ATPase subunit C [Saccharopolyspora sp. WRP15-2]|uniref:Potassium-transporting ATPase KdpC subunit n=1 Tax=Saccharopolyspora oryzae TaxID=2997343 RepID=A0ABT4UQ70_9PSEU|nr:potassium-transporting ATPase subunit C [Saccharopolyspora oryzae]MDA3623880.1 potassium-transporting ATPase subunit C [Saccharopolyspora oryzae]